MMVPDPADRRISVVIPCFDAARHLRETLDSVVSQTVVPVDVVIVDDGSTDGTVAIAEEFRNAHEDLDVHIKRLEHAGATVARNVGASLASGDLLMFLDADDLLDPDTLEHLSNAIAGKRDAVAIGPWCRLERIDGRWQRRPASCSPRRPGDDVLAGWLRNWYHPPCSVLWTRSGFERAGRWDETCGQNQDGDLMMRAFLHGVELCETTQGCSAYRRPHEAGHTISGRRASPSGLMHRLRVVAKIGALAEDAGTLASYRGPLCDALRDIIDDARTAAGPDAAAVRSLARRLRFGLRPLPDRLLGIFPARLVARPSGRVPRPPAAVLPEVADQATPFGDAASPLVSVVIPTFDRAEEVVTAIDSVLAQDYQNVEILVVDDASTDNSVDVVASHRDPRVRVLRRSTNGGAGAARNLGLRAARGELIAFLDSDDVWLPGKLAAQVARFEASPASVGLVYGGVEVEHGDGAVSASTPDHRGDLHRLLLERNVIHGGGSNVIIRRAVVASAGFFDERFHAVEDHDYWVRVARMFDVEFVDQPVCRYRDADDDSARRSRHVDRNLASRELFARKHRRQMLRNRTASTYDLETARRALRDADDRQNARRCAWRAVASDPLSVSAWGRALRLSLPTTVVAALRCRARRPAAAAPLRVAVYSSTSTNESGGVQRVVDTLVGNLRHGGHDVVEIRADVPVDPERPAVEVAPVVVPDARAGHRVRSIAGTWRTGIHLAAVLARHRPDIVNVHFLYPPEVIHLVALRWIFGYRLVLTAHGSDVLRPIGPKTRWLPFLLRRADAITTVAPTLTNRVVETTGVDPARVVTVPNRIDLDFWRRTEPAPLGAETVVAVGRLTPVKGFDVLVDALPVILDAFPGVRVTMVGDGPEHARLRRRADSLGVGRSLEMTGVLAPSELRQVLSRAAVFAMPSRSEGMPLALLEAMAAGRAPVVSDVDGIAGICGPAVRVPPENPSALGGAIVELLQDPDRCRALGRRAQSHVECLVSDQGPSYVETFRACVRPTAMTGGR